MSNKIIINQYPKQKYSTFFNQLNGAFIRIEDEGEPEPFWSEKGPELMDISITNWCDKGCSFCYRNSNSGGEHMSMSDYEHILKEAVDCKVLQIALGGGNPNQHPNFCEIVEITRDLGIVPSYTTNGRGLSEKILKTTKKNCGAVAVSAYEPYYEMKEAIHKLKAKRIKTNIHFLLTSNSIDTVISWFEDPPNFFNYINAIIFLNYKPIGKHPSLKLIANKHNKIDKFFNLISNQKRIKVGFDSCSISGIAQYLDINPSFVESCEAARFSMYISEDLKMYPCSFMAGKYDGIDLSKNSIQDAWRYSTLFRDFRKHIKNSECKSCKHNQLCFGGCPIFPEINFCDRRG